jgi:hypothetical protein
MRIGRLVALVGAFCWATAERDVASPPVTAAAPTTAAFRKSRLDIRASSRQ